MEIWLIGTGSMAIEYAKVLNGLGMDFIVIGRGEENCRLFEKETGLKPISGGVEAYFESGNVAPDYVINSVGIDKLAEVTRTLLNHGCKSILVEKPGVAYPDEIGELSSLAKEKKAKVLLAYNRRFYQSTLATKKFIEQEGGVTSFNFEFTEWSHQIEGIKHLKTESELQNWFLGNSTHVIDLAFYLGGKPRQLSSFFAGQNKIDWHTKSSNFSGAGISVNGALFSYIANWKSPGRFSVEILTSKSRYIFRPLEKLQVQKIGSVAVNLVEEIDYTIDEKYKPGLFLQTKAYLENRTEEFVDIIEQETLINEFYKQMSGY